ncbi:hypothetical protein H257_07927 [Aphanomyces astaci]|uniref:Attractin/MKLN-like beta-propeller domain-containing protein n=1 Tax=Aphanomyces astaci TaxID=112090 RepID=W4GH19_APHAT|nr:hypothetical protein H257_07927 [Aphanomyces astaci]ETV78349.1 hypothetical protein H257_07927 [Aphanomyces astaci]RHY95701.1 hypothetical protein DYB35_006491 [Aphanomyces astaci]RHZ16010.1 hypothetical protein DYB37_010110 [Aphanomyces astaci]|eukprot:XP_009831930.1 hypothetical protein H257_07927 [Aphanomyces astaci]
MPPKKVRKVEEGASATTADETASVPPPAPTTDTTTALLKCDVCGDSSFPSRNKLFRHLKDCAVNLAFHTVNTALVETPTDVTNVYYYVTGGRLRGRTLGSVERYSLHRKCWEAAPSMQENRGSHGAVGVGNQLYILGGGGFRSNLATCERLDITNDKWTAIAPMTTYRHALAVVHVPELKSIYCIGGWVNGSKCSPVLEKYDVDNNSWTTCTPMDVPRRLLGATAFESKLYVFGGNADDHEDKDKKWYTDAVESYNASTNAWTRLAPLPTPGPCSAVTVGAFIFVFLHGKSVLRYDPAADTFTTLAPLPLAEWFCFDAKALGHTVYVNGGITKGVWSKAFYLYDTLANTWTELPSMQTARRRCAAALVHAA